MAYSIEKDGLKVFIDGDEFSIDGLYKNRSEINEIQPEEPWPREY